MKQCIKRLALNCSLIVLMIQLSGCSASKGIQPSQITCNQFLQLMRSHNSSAAYKLLTTKCKAATTKQQMQNYWELVEKNRGKVQSWSQQGYRIGAGAGASWVNLSYELQSTNGKSYLHFNCVEENGKWLIQGFNFQG